MLYEFENALGGIVDPSSTQHPSRSLISFICAYGQSSSIQTTGFQWVSSPKTEILILWPISHFIVDSLVCVWPKRSIFMSCNKCKRLEFDKRHWHLGWNRCYVQMTWKQKSLATHASGGFSIEMKAENNHIPTVRDGLEQEFGPGISSSPAHITVRTTNSSQMFTYFIFYLLTQASQLRTHSYLFICSTVPVKSLDNTYSFKGFS